MHMDCSTRGSAPSRGVIVLLGDCPASAPVVTTIGRPSAGCQILLPLAAVRPRVPFLLAVETFFFRCSKTPPVWRVDAVWLCGDCGVALAFPVSFPLPLGVAPSCIGAGCALMSCCVCAISRISTRVLIQVSNRAVLRMRCSVTRESCVLQMTTPILRSSSTAFRDCTSSSRTRR